MEEQTRLILSVVFSLLTCLLMILSILFFPEIKIKSLALGTYWVIVLVGAMVVVAVSGTDLKKIGESLVEDSEINPLKILTLFISMTILSVYLDEIGFFQYLANLILKKAKTSQKKLFFFLFLMVSILTVFTSNDVIILSFTPFICYFARDAHISPIPYLTAEFVAANTWSMTLIIGNPTNIYLGTANSIDFLTYVKVMAVPTIIGGCTALACLFLTNLKFLNQPIKTVTQENLVGGKISIRPIDAALKESLVGRNTQTETIREEEPHKEEEPIKEEEVDKEVDKEEDNKNEDNKEEAPETEEPKKEEEVKEEDKKEEPIEVPKELTEKKSPENEGMYIELKETVSERTTQTEIVKEKPQEYQIKSKPLLIIGVTILAVCIILLAIGSYINLQMWIVTFFSAIILFASVLICSAIIKRSPIELWYTLKRAPWELIPFVLGMFIMILCIDDLGVTKAIGDFLGENLLALKYGGLAFLFCNIINNIPMSVLFSGIMKGLPSEIIDHAIYTTVASSNVGAFFTPIGALAGIMFTSILKKFGLKFGYLDFLKVGVTTSIPTIIVTLYAIELMLWLYGK